ncbi:MAG TPA: glucose 1-dehydrogenase [Acidimicrobiales bacterium]|nr:glucose 1-dehydrogenase [Acidimicrobiales bacterium]
MSPRLDGKVALITGAARGQGEAEARLFAGEGASVAICDVREEEGRAVAAELGGRACFHRLDVTRPDEWDGAVAAVLHRFGSLQVLVNNAGIGAVGTLDGMPLEEHARIVDVNLNGVYYGMRAAKAALAATGNGSIVNVSSIDGLAGVLGMTSYVASKFAVTGMTRSAAIELGPLGVRVNSIHPGVIDTPMLGGPDSPVRPRLQRLMERQPIRRMGRPEEVAFLALFLASDESSYITGAAIPVDGGHLAGPFRDYTTEESTT